MKCKSLTLEHDETTSDGNDGIARDSRDSTYRKE